MSIIGSNILAGSAGQGGGYTIERSLRLRSSASAYLNRTPASAGNRKTWTWSGWVKRGKISDSSKMLFSTGSTSSNYDALYITTADILQIFGVSGGSAYLNINTTAVFRDASAWYHILFKVDTTQATSTNRYEIWVNGAKQTLNYNTVPAQNTDGFINNNALHYVGARTYDTGIPFDGYLTEVNFIDGQALTPSDFGNYNEDTGVWQPAEYIGSYGTNGFYLPFSDNTTTTTLAEDASGNGNDWTPNNISLTSGVTYDSMTDTPTPYADGGNYAVLNPLAKNSSTSITNGNLSASGNVVYGHAQSTIFASSGKWYFEAQLTTQQNDTGIGLGNTDSNPTGQFTGGDTNSVGYLSDGRFFYNGSLVATYSSYTTTDVIACAFDCVTGKIWIAKNNTWQNSGNPAAGTGQVQTVSWTEFAALARTVGSGAIAFNFGQRPFAYTPPTGFLPLHTGNLPDSSIVDGSKYFNAVTYTGDSSSQSITGVGFQPDFLWIKGRNVAYSHYLFDSIRGVGKYLNSNGTSAETTNANYLTSFDSDGFTPGTGGGVNESPNTYVAWNWKANGAGVSNTDGSITSTVSASPTAGFSIVTYTGTGSAATVGHGLGVAPSMIIAKTRSLAAKSWPVYSKEIGAGKYLVLNSTNGSATDTNMWQNTTPTSSVFNLGTDSWNNGSSATYVAYCFADVEGYSKFGSYTGNGSADGPFVFCGFRPAYVMVKRTDAVTTYTDWVIRDSSRTPYNTDLNVLGANRSDAESYFIGNTNYEVDFVSNGFKLRANGSSQNASGGTYIYMAFAEVPFSKALAR